MVVKEVLNLSNVSDSLNFLQNIKYANERLSKVLYRKLRFWECYKKYDKEWTLFYLDLPYFGTDSYYKNVEFVEEDHKRLFEILKNTTGKWILNYNDCDYIKELYKDFNIDEVERHSNLKTKYEKGAKYYELIIRNY